jgi:hypothetical protein
VAIRIRFIRGIDSLKSHPKSIKMCLLQLLNQDMGFSGSDSLGRTNSLVSCPIGIKSEVLNSNIKLYI